MTRSGARADHATTPPVVRYLRIRPSPQSLGNNQRRTVEMADGDKLDKMIEDWVDDICTSDS